MTTVFKSTEKEEVKLTVKVKLAAMWAALMLMYIYADIFSLFRPGSLVAITAGRMGPFAVTQGLLAAFSIMMIIPAVMVFLSIALQARVNRWVNIILGVLYTFVNISNLVGETWAYYILFGVVELLFTLMIVWNAYRWPNREVLS
ncbi:MAG: DUF6326 family protein [Anaerolineae bacterium]